ncbi:hypothetical protein D9758_013236 [Tetrapyrgos nigripes]|uniref:Uncharacterized protein n=1 Tax=Tetrapyrgos nigripes TaxID=182062 RepID=A0A8H5CN97_9AGAR|nr:hypothetical protein D9758_013236 [Tetrapyrgos nigripes]
MYVPFITTTWSATGSNKVLGKRKGGGGGGRSSGGRSSSSSGKSSGSSGKSGGRSSSSTIFGGSRTSRPYGNGGGKPTVVPAGQPFSGRSVGGGMRSQVFGSRTYGSGYPGYGLARGVAGRGFPFYFWPLVWGGAVGVGTASYLNAEDEVHWFILDPSNSDVLYQYGQPNNSTRPGGMEVTAAFQSNYTQTIFRIMSDNETVVSLIQDIHQNCSSRLTSNSASSPSQIYLYNTSASDAPKPEQAIQYYRASSAVLTLDGYNNSAAFGANGTTDTPLPDGIDTMLLQCLNGTIGNGITLVDGAGGRWTAPSYGVVGLLWTLWILSHIF